MAPDHKQISKKIDQDFDDLQARNPEAYQRLEDKYRRLQAETNYEVSVSRVPGHVARAERLS